MKCMSCDMEINPKWNHAIDINVCPFCGHEIMEVQLKNLFTSLNETMKGLSEYPNQLNDWMLSNHDYIRTNSESLPLYLSKDYLEKIEANVLEKASVKRNSENTDDFEARKNKKFKTKIINDAGEEEEVSVEKIQSEEKTSEFYKRAEAIKPNIDGFKSVSEKTQHLKALAQQIKREGSSVVNHSGDSMSSEMADPEAVAEMQSMMSGGDIISSALPSDSGDDEIPSVILNMASKARGSGKDSQADLEKLHKLQNKVSGSRKNFLSGGGGFSRA